MPKDKKINIRLTEKEKKYNRIKSKKIKYDYYKIYHKFLFKR